MSARVSAATQSLVPVGIDPAHVGDVLAPLSVACAAPEFPSRAYVNVRLLSPTRSYRRHYRRLPTVPSGEDHRHPDLEEEVESSTAERRQSVICP